MPVVSKRQNRFFRAHEHDKGKLGTAARAFIKDTKPGSIKKLPESTDRSKNWYEAKS